MPEALARTDYDFVVAQKPRKEPRKPGKAAQKSSPTGVMRIIRAYPAATLGVIGGAALICGILVNALVLQTQRHPAPLFAAPAPHQTAPASVSPAPVLPAPATPAVVPQPAPRPANLAPVVAEKPAPAQRPAAREPAAREAAEAPPRGDAIASLLRAGAAPQGGEASRTVQGAQRALVKLGFVLRADGVMGGTTRQAIERFERDRGLPVRGDLTPKIIKMLSAESGVAID